MSYPKDFRIAIVGGGMCGLACAVGLSKAGIHVDLFESASKFGEVGAGVGLGPNAVRALDGLGLLDAVLCKSDEPKATPRPILFLSGLDGHELIYDYPITPADAGLGIHRAAFLDAIVNLVDPEITHFGKQCTSVSASPDSGAYILHFTDGTIHEADVVIGADGIRSAVRNAVVDGSKHLVFTNTVAYRGLVPTETLRLAGVKTNLSQRPICFAGPDKHLILFPIKAGQIINIVVFATNRQVPMGQAIPLPWVAAALQEQLLEDFKGWGNDVTATIKCLKTPSKWSIHGLYPTLETYVRDNIVLVGDAAHGMLPHLGAGVGQGFEDVYLLCRLLSHSQTTASNVKDVLQAYNIARVPRANMVANCSLEAGNIYEAYGTNGCAASDIQERLKGMLEPIWRHDLENDFTSAIEQLKQRGTFV